MAESSSACRWKYDVYLSFRGEDTREGFISHLHHDLILSKIKTFKDDTEVEVGQPIAPTLVKAIEESRCAVVVLSPNYASSSWCLEELTQICQCMEDNNRILPLFYHVYPSDVRKQKGTFEVAFTKHVEDGQDPEKVKVWRDALVKVANFSGWHTQNFKSERELVTDIVKSICHSVGPSEIEFSMSTGDFEAFEATRQAMDELMKALRDDKVTSIAVLGMGGVGKTTMVEYVALLAQNSGIFRHVVMAVISQTQDLRSIQGTLADLLGLELKEETDIGRADKLKREIMRRNKLLVILDDIWERIDLSSIGIPNYDELQLCNSKVLFTTRRLNVCHSMAAQSRITLNVLSEEDSWSLFVRIGRLSFEKLTEFYDVARKVARECAGLPIALVTVARALGDKDLEEWEEAARRLEMAQTSHFDDTRAVYKCIRLSYDYLNSEDARSCFLLCCLFPEDHYILIEDLLKYGLGIGLFRCVNTGDIIQKARTKSNLAVKYLIASNLLLRHTENNCVRMHDVIRDIAMSIALSEDGRGFLVKTRCGLKNWPMDANEGYSAISLMENDICKLPQKLVCPKLQILLLKGNSEIEEVSNTSFQSPTALRVLDLSGTRIWSLPPSFKRFCNLHALHLDFCESIIDVSMLGKLKKLEILSMRGCQNKEFPVEIGHLTNLRMLDLTNAEFDTVPSRVISKLHRLEELNMKCKFGSWGRRVGEGSFFRVRNNAGFNELTSLSHLNVLEVAVSGFECLPQIVEFDPNWVCFDISIHQDEHFRRNFLPSDFYHRRRTLSLDTSSCLLPKWFITLVTNKVEMLFYVGCKNLFSILYEHDHGRLHRLKWLSVQGSCMLEEFLNTHSRDSDAPVFEFLEDLHLVNLQKLKELCVGELPPRSLCSLQSLVIEECHALVDVLLPTKLLLRLQNLEEIVCLNSGMVYVFDFECLEPEQVPLKKLRRIKLDGLGLRGIWKYLAPQEIFHNLKSLTVQRCGNLYYLFTSDVARCLLQLEDLVVDECIRLDRIIEAREETLNNKKIVFPKLETLVLVHLSLLRRLCGPIRGATSLQVECTSLRHLYVHNCPRLSISAFGFNSNYYVQFNDEHHRTSLEGRFTSVQSQKRHSHQIQRIIRKLM